LSFSILRHYSDFRRPAECNTVAWRTVRDYERVNVVK